MSKRKKTGKNQITVPPWHLLEPWQTTAWLKVDPERGLDSRQAEERLAIHGLNAIREQQHRSVAKIFFGQFADFMILILIVAGIVPECSEI